MRDEYFASFKSERPAQPAAKRSRWSAGRSITSTSSCRCAKGLPSKETAADGHYAAGAAHLANLAYRKGRRMQWDLKTNKVTEG